MHRWTKVHSQESTPPSMIRQRHAIPVPEDGRLPLCWTNTGTVGFGVWDGGKDLVRIADDHLFNRYIERWALTPGGDPIITRSSRLLPALRQGEPAMLKIAAVPEEQWGAGLMIWWNGIGAARVIEYDDHAILLERATGNGSLAKMAKDGGDDQATRIICDVVATLHTPRAAPVPDLIPLMDWFQPLITLGEGGILGRTAETARMLLADPREVVVLHGDIHHENILDFAGRGWLAIDPKRICGRMNHWPRAKRNGHGRDSRNVADGFLQITQPGP